MKSVLPEIFERADHRVSTATNTLFGVTFAYGWPYAADGGLVTQNMFTRLTLITAALTAALAITAATVGARIFTNTIGGEAALIGDGHVAQGIVLLDCTAGQQVQFTLTLIQDGASGTGHGAGVCTGGVSAYEVTVQADGDTFTPGLAAACAAAVNYRRGRIDDTKEWCRAAGVVLSAN